MDLFDFTAKKKNTHEPLAVRMRPRNLDEFVGQKHLLDKGKLLRTLIESDQIQSMILQGPPATGKTTLATIISSMTNAEFVKLNAISLAIAELRSILEKARENLKYYQKRTIVFIDEIHAMKSNVQMSLLQAVEDGTFILIGATTESVTHDIIPPLTSRCKVYTLSPLAPIDIKKIINSALTDSERGLGSHQLKIDESALSYVADICNGDVRSALNALEVAASSLKDNETIDLNTIQQAFEFRLNGISTTDFYDLTSAFIKSMRGSQTNAALYWLARLLVSGVDPIFLARRIVIHAAEDVGLANPQALQIAVAAKQAVEFIGMPEARIPLAEAVIYISESPKSNSAYKAIHSALELVKRTHPYPVPNQLKNSTGLYVNPIDTPGTPLAYLPVELNEPSLYTPQNSGMEEKIFAKYNQKV
ncbi:Replication-associated recombination protein A [Sporomusa acidovorans DSM 3132]|uniref:Replication-associated recombination protein A n=2 Tax=Sporomusa TaxID=2375 RepID=A0ABZ3J451_SPOA4|nr:replication-associated recombination protein A [Sporomusa acidovorans DSM 3132]SDE59786.1 putative ATPase [Sporomusa acidovorans]